jgi:hypothetical protein
MADVVEEVPPPVVPEVDPAPPVENQENPAPSEAPVVTEPVVEKDALAEKVSAAVKQSFLPEDAEFLLAKNYLTTKMGVKHPVSMYDHLTSIIMHSLESKSANIVGRI